MLAVAEKSAAVESVAVGPARLGVERLGPGLAVHDVRRVAGCWLLTILCQQRAISRVNFELTVTLRETMLRTE